MASYVASPGLGYKEQHCLADQAMQSLTLASNPASFFFFFFFFFFLEAGFKAISNLCFLHASLKFVQLLIHHFSLLLLQHNLKLSLGFLDVG